MRIAVSVACAVFAAACSAGSGPGAGAGGGAGAPASGDGVVSGVLGGGKADEAGRLRPTGFDWLFPGETRAGEVLRHGVVEVDVDIRALFGIGVNVTFPPDFFVEVHGYAVPAEAGRTIDVAIDGPRVLLVVKRIGSDLAASFHEGNLATVVTDIAGDYLFVVVPTEIRPGADHITFDITAR